jgi:hypothetical protein
MLLPFRLIEESSQYEKEDPGNWDLANQSKVMEGAVKKDRKRPDRKTNSTWSSATLLDELNATPVVYVEASFYFERFYFERPTSAPQTHTANAVKLVHRYCSSPSD